MPADPNTPTSYLYPPSRAPAQGSDCAECHVLLLRRAAHLRRGGEQSECERDNGVAWAKRGWVWRGPWSVRDGVRLGVRREVASRESRGTVWCDFVMRLQAGGDPGFCNNNQTIHDLIFATQHFTH